jgi:hypothetical protein
MNCNPSFSPPWTLDSTDSPSEILSESPCCNHRTADVSDVGSAPDSSVGPVPRRAWQMMADDELTFGGDWTGEIDGGSRG